MSNLTKFKCAKAAQAILLAIAAALGAGTVAEATAPQATKSQTNPAQTFQPQATSGQATPSQITGSQAIAAQATPQSAATQDAGSKALSAAAEADHKRLQHGDVVVDLKDEGATKFVVGTIMIDETPDHIWSVMTNPFEYQHQICRRMKEVQVMQDSGEATLLKCKIDCGLFLPEFYYVVESHYKPDARIDFHRISGNIRDFKGSWLLTPSTTNPKQTKVTYSMYIDPGYPLPQWVIREGVKMELPKTLTALRSRVRAIYQSHATPDPKSILACHLKSSPNTSATASIQVSEVGIRD